MMNVNENKENAIAILANLSDALEACGIENEFVEDTESVFVGFFLWNCVNGNEEYCAIYAENVDNYESIQHYTQPSNDMKAFEERLDRLTA